MPKTRFVLSAVLVLGALVGVHCAGDDEAPVDAGVPDVTLPGADAGRDANVADTTVPDAGRDAAEDATVADAGADAPVEAAAASDAPVDAPADAALDAATVFAPLTGVSNWEAFDLRTLATTPSGLEGALFDGRYVYYVPYGSGSTTPSGLTVRYDTQGAFTSASSWEEFDLFAQLGARGYTGAIYDGRYVMYLPTNNNGTMTRVVRYDTQASFTAPASWESYDLTNGAGQFVGAAFDGRYIYAAPYNTNVVARFDTTMALSAGWTYYDLSYVRAPLGFSAPSFDGQYVYFTPLQPGAKLVRYDTKAAFLAAASWVSVDLAAQDVHATGFQSSSFDGRRITFVPSNDPTGTTLRYDTTQPLDGGPYERFAISSLLDGGAVSYCGSQFDGKYLYFAPLTSPFARLDTTMAMDAAGAWSLFDAVDAGLLGDAGVAKFCGGAFDGEYVYFSPFGQPIALRFHAKTPRSLPPRLGSFL